MSTFAAEVRLAPGFERLLTAALIDPPASPTMVGLQLLAERLLLVAGFDELVCLERLSFKPFDYQVKAAQVALRRFRGEGCCAMRLG